MSEYPPGTTSLHVISTQIWIVKADYGWDEGFYGRVYLAKIADSYNDDYVTQDHIAMLDTVIQKAKEHLWKSYERRDEWPSVYSTKAFW